MLVRLTRTKRLKSGWLLTLAYLLCVLSPGASFAFADGPRAAPCLTDESHLFGVVHVHQHVHPDGTVHSHSALQAAPVAAADHGKSLVLNDGSDSGKPPHKTDTSCCSLVAPSAIPASLFEIVDPLAPVTVYVAENSRDVAGKSPPRLYRPPIS